MAGNKNISILHSPCRMSDLQFSLVLQTHALVLKNCTVCNKENGWGGGGGDVFEDPYITAKMIFTHCSQFHNCNPYTDKRSFTLSWDFLFSKSRLLSAFSAGTFVCQTF